ESADGLDTEPGKQVLIEIARFEVPTGRDLDWADMLRLSFGARLSDLVKLWAECLQLSAVVTSKTRHISPQTRELLSEAAPRSLHTDKIVALVSALVAGLTTFAVGMFSVAIQWNGGSLAVMFSALCLALFTSPASVADQGGSEGAAP